MESTRIPAGPRPALLALLCAAALAALLAPPLAATRAAAASLEEGSRGLSVTVQPGDSWSVIRGRMFPTEAIMSVNPGLARNGLRPGDVVRAPFVPLSRLDAALDRLSQAEAKLRETTAEKTALEKRVAESAAIEKTLAAERRASDRSRFISFALATAALVLGGALAGVLLFLRLARREARVAEAALAKTEARYAELRKQLREIEIDLQRRMVNLLHLHDVRVVTEEEVGRATAPLVDLAAELKKKHAG